MIGKRKRDSSTDLLRLLSFYVGDKEFAVEFSQVQEIKIESIVNVLKSSSFGEGVINLKDKVIPVIDLMKRFNLGERKTTEGARVVVVRHIEGRAIGLIVDSIPEVLSLPAYIIEPLILGMEFQYIKGICKRDDRLLMLIDLENIFSMEDEGCW